MTATITPAGVLTVWGLEPLSPWSSTRAPPGPRATHWSTCCTPAAVAAGQAGIGCGPHPRGALVLRLATSTGWTSQLDAGPVLRGGPTRPRPRTPPAGRCGPRCSPPPPPPLPRPCWPWPAIPTQQSAPRPWPNWPTGPTTPSPWPTLSCPLSASSGWPAATWCGSASASARNPGTGPDTLAHLTGDPDPHVLAALARIIDLPAALLIQLARTPDPNVQAELRRNPSAKFLYSPQSPPPAHSPHRPDQPDPPPHPPGPPPKSPRPTGPAPPTWSAVGGPPSPAPALEATPIPTAAAADPTHPRLPRRAVGVLVAAAAVVLLTLGGYTAVTTLGTEPAQTASVSATVPWNGMSLPTGPDGPADPAGPVAAGFAHTELGAAMAAAHLSVRIDPYAGPASFEPTITTQTFGGDPAALLGATQDRYDTAAARAGVTYWLGRSPPPPARSSAGTSTGWAPDAPTTVHLLVTGPDGTDTDYGIGVVWVDGDYRLLDPTRDDTFTTTPAADPETYRRF